MKNKSIAQTQTVVIGVGRFSRILRTEGNED
jgi:hypothetical protein